MKKQSQKNTVARTPSAPKKSSAPQKTLVLGAAVLASLAGAYFLYGSKDAGKNRKHVKGWIVKAKGEVIEKLEQARTETEVQYSAVVDAVLKKYKAVKSIDTTEVEDLGRDLKKHWKVFQREMKKVKKP